MTKKPVTFSVALSQTTKPKAVGRPAYMLDKARQVLEKQGQWELFRECLVDKSIPVRAIHEALALSGIKVSFPTVQKWRKEAIAKNNLIWAQVYRDMALAELDKVLEAQKS